MSSDPKRPKRPRDPAQLAKLIVDIARGEATDADPNAGKDPAAAATRPLQEAGGLAYVAPVDWE
jgi:hypothetical protein